MPQLQADYILQKELMIWRCFKQLLVHVNLNQKKLKHLRHDYAAGINDLDLVGLSYL